MRRYELTDDQYERIAPLLPKRLGPKGGRPWRDHRTILNGVLWIVRSGAPWRDLPERYGPWQSVYERFNRWRADGTWDRILAFLQSELEAAGEIDWSLFCIDGTNVRAARCAAGAQKNSAIRESRRTTRSAARGAGSGRSSI